MPSHSHKLNAYVYDPSFGETSTLPARSLYVIQPPKGDGVQGSVNITWEEVAKEKTSSNLQFGSMEEIGGSQAHNILDPYYAENVWRRIA